ncbi:hypothetical protein HXY33_07035 [Candidatus Bathyarchaeota archaeon]|nr:hypothetical protein [Candidatus Bathyarchaeota archaeon]
MFPHLEVFPEVNTNTIRYNQTSTTFNVDIMMKDADPERYIAGVELLLFYNNTFLDIVDISHGDFFERYTSLVYYYFEVSRELGRVTIASAILLPATSYWPNGNGKIATLKFNATYDLKSYPSVLQSQLNITVAVDLGMTSYFVDTYAKEFPYDPAIGGCIELRMKMHGDVNLDGIVNAGDAVLLGLAFASEPSDPDWNDRQMKTWTAT